MKILQIFNKYAHMGGEEIAVGRISAELADHHELRDVIFDSNEWTARTGPLNRIQQFLSMAWNPSSIRRIRDEIEAFQPDLILLHNLMPVGSAGLYLYLQHQDRPLVHFIHNFRPFSVSGYCWGGRRLLPAGLDKNFIPEIVAGAWQESRVKTAWYAVLIWGLHLAGAYRRIDGWIAISDFMKSAFMKGGIDPEKIRVISHGWTPQCDDAELEAITGSVQEPNILYLGRLTEEKGVRVLLDAWREVKRAGHAGLLTLAGDGPLSREVEEICLALPDARWVGFTSGEAKRKLLRECSALAVPSIWWEPLGLVLYEAYDFGKPVLAARSGGIVDHVEDGATGWLHTPGDSAELAQHMIAAMSQPVEARRRGAQGRALLMDRSSHIWIREFDSFVSQVVKQSRAPKSGIPGIRPPLRVSVYLADQNPGYDRSFGISRMSQTVLASLSCLPELEISAITSTTSQQAPEAIRTVRKIPWGTRNRLTRLVTDHFHPVLCAMGDESDVHYFPKGYLPLLALLCRPTVVTIHDTIIQYDEDRYPEWRKGREYAYWARMLKHTLRHADRILTVSESSKRQIQAFMVRHGIPPKEISVTYEPCLYECIPQPVEPAKRDYVIHLASVEPHKRTAHLIRWWTEASAAGKKLPMLHLIGSVPPEVAALVSSSKSIEKRPFLDDAELQEAYRSARSLILPSEIEGFGLPALEAYYLGTPVCFVEGTSVEEILSVATRKGRFSLEDPASMFVALDETLAMSAEEVRRCGLKLRESYATSRIAVRMVAEFQAAARDFQVGNPHSEE